MTDFTTQNKSGWVKVAFGECVEVVRENGVPTAQESKSYIGLEHMVSGELNIASFGSDVSIKVPKTKIKKGDVLFARRNTHLRRCALAPFDTFFSPDGYAFRSSSNQIMQEYLLYLVASEGFMDFAVSRSAGTHSKRVKWSDLQSFEFMLPPLQEQARLVETAKSFLKLHQSLRLARLSLETIRKAVIKDFEITLGKSDFTQLGAIIDKIKVGRSPKSPGRPAGANEFGVLKVSAVGDWDFVPEENKVIDAGEFRKNFEVRTNDLLVTRANANPDWVARSCLVEDETRGLMLSDKTWCLEINEDVRHCKQGILAWTKSNVFRTFILNQLSGTDAKNISQAAFLKAPFPTIDQRFIYFNSQMNILANNIKSLLNREISASRNFQIFLQKVMN